MKPVDGAQDYLGRLQARAKQSRAYTKHQDTGLQLAALLRDRAHAALYIKLAKENDPDELLRLAKSITEKEGVQNPGAYFMASLQKIRKGRSHR